MQYPLDFGAWVETETVGHWQKVRDGDALARAIMKRHYSYRRYRDGRSPKL